MIVKNGLIATKITKNVDFKPFFKCLVSAYRTA
nr:MAG TPA: hypothetical protein [Caudoviricetes sp.]